MFSRPPGLHKSISSLLPTAAKLQVSIMGKLEIQWLQIIYLPAQAYTG